MANNKNVYQQSNTVSIPREEFLNIIHDTNLNKADIRVFCVLLSQLDGYSKPTNNQSKPDPRNFKRINISNIAEFLDITEKKARNSIDKLTKKGIIERGNSELITKGYRFTF